MTTPTTTPSFRACLSSSAGPWCSVRSGLRPKAGSETAMQKWNLLRGEERSWQQCSRRLWAGRTDSPSAGKDGVFMGTVASLPAISSTNESRTPGGGLVISVIWRITAASSVCDLPVDLYLTPPGLLNSTGCTLDALVCIFTLPPYFDDNNKQFRFWGVNSELKRTFLSCSHLRQDEIHTMIMWNDTQPLTRNVNGKKIWIKNKQNWDKVTISCQMCLAPLLCEWKKYKEIVLSKLLIKFLHKMTLYCIFYWNGFVL